MADLIRSPFPGMDPYLERHPGDVLLSLNVYSTENLNQQLPNNLVARIRVSPDRRRTVHIHSTASDERSVCVLYFVHPADDELMSRLTPEIAREHSVVVNLFRGKRVGYCCLHLDGPGTESFATCHSKNGFPRSLSHSGPRNPRPHSTSNNWWTGPT
jgi:hypothetical protein